MRVEIWSDVVCPWCYIGKRRFETALDRVGATRDVSTLEIVYRPYQLDPTAQPGRSQPVIEAYAKKFGGPERAAEIIEQVTSVAAESGLDFHMDIALRANTLLAHRLLWFAETHVVDGIAMQTAMKERLLRAYFVEGLDVGDAAVLATLAAEVGFDLEQVSDFLAGDGGHAEVMEELAVAASNGITAVPTFVFDGKWAVPGAQDVDVFERVLIKLLATEDEALAAAGNDV